jgi:sugar lactone lactonase YvrE
VVPTKTGDLVAATAKGFVRFDPQSGVLTALCDPEPGRSEHRFNDGKCDPWGRFWAGTMTYDFSPGAGSLWRLNNDFSCSLQWQELTISNGLAWSLDRRFLYLIDSPTLTVLAFPLTSTGSLAGHPTACITIPAEWDALPDGMCIDAEGKLWIALFGGGAVTRWNPLDGRLMQTVELPCRQVTSCCFGGPDLDQLLITTARRGLDAQALGEQPLAGGLFQLSPGIKGCRSEMFRV